jgi:plasmid stabilization system protein ParE
MTRVELAPEIREDFERILDHLAKHEVDDSPARIGEIIQAIAVLEQNPMIGRPVRGNTRELVIGRRTRGYVALYRYIADIDTVFVLALRSQREAGYARGNE